MKSISEIQHQLNKLGIRNLFWVKPEIRELQHILTEGEFITHASTGWYQGGFALILTTNHRLLLVDKKMLYLNVEDVRFDMISEVDFSARLLNATLSVQTLNNVVRFSSTNRTQLRNLTRYLQSKILELRHIMLQQSQPMPAQYIQYQASPSPQDLMYTHNQDSNEPVQQEEVFADSGEYTFKDNSNGEQQPSQAHQQLYNSSVNYSRPRALRRIGAYPTSTLTLHSNYNPISKR